MTFLIFWSEDVFLQIVNILYFFKILFSTFCPLQKLILCLHESFIYIKKNLFFVGMEENKEKRHCDSNIAVVLIFLVEGKDTDTFLKLYDMMSFKIIYI